MAKKQMRSTAKRGHYYEPPQDYLIAKALIAPLLGNNRPAISALEYLVEQAEIAGVVMSAIANHVDPDGNHV